MLWCMCVFQDKVLLRIYDSSGHGIIRRDDEAKWLGKDSFKGPDLLFSLEPFSILFP